MNQWEIEGLWKAVAVIGMVLLASLGGFLGSTIRRLDERKKLDWFVISVETMASAFSGVIVLLVCIHYEVSLAMTGAVVGLCGWLGGRTTMLWLQSRITQVIGGGKTP